jgi:hypothetical protein
MLGVMLNAASNQLTATPVNISSSGDNIVVSGANGKVTRVYKLFIVATSSVTLTFKDGASNSLSGPIALAANESLTLSFDNASPWFQTTAGNNFIINLGSGVQVSGVAYFQQG